MSIDHHPHPEEQPNLLTHWNHIPKAQLSSPRSKSSGSPVLVGALLVVDSESMGSGTLLALVYHLGELTLSHGRKKLISRA